MGIDEIKRLKAEAREPKTKKAYYIPKVSAKRKANLVLEKQTQAEDDAFYEMLWQKKPHICYECGVWLGYKLRRWFFHHTIEKAPHPEFRHDERVILFLCQLHHDQCRFGKGLDMVPKVKAYTEEIRKLLLHE